MKKFVALGWALCATALSACQPHTPQNFSQDIADTLYLNAKVYTVDDKNSWADGFAVKGNRFIAVGNQQQLSAYQGDKTRIVDLGGKMVLPGLVEDHVHPDMASENRMGITLKPSQMSWNEQAQIIRRFAEQDSGSGWIIGGNLNWLADNGEHILDTEVASHFSTLDRLVKNRPIMLWDIGGHAVLLNSLAMQRMKITADTPVPAGGVIVKDANGQPTGVLRETAANWVYETAMQDLPRGKTLIERGIKPVFALLNARGYTAITDAWARDYMLDAYRDMADNGELNLRLRAYIADPIEWLTKDGKAKARHAITHHKNYYRENWLDAAGVKFVLDGSAGGQTIIMVEPYEGTEDVHGGPWRNDPDYFKKQLQEYDAMGLTVKAHGVGSQTIRTILDAIEAVRAKGSTRRHSVAHSVLIHPDDLPRFKKLDAVAEFSPYFWYPVSGWSIVRQEIGHHRVNWAFPVKTLSEQGVHIAAGADWPISEDPAPFPQIESMVTRQAPGAGKQAPALNPKEGVSLATAIRILTMGGAYAQNRDEVIGSIEAGKFADFIVLDQNLFDVDTYAIHKTKVLQTVVDGRVVYQYQH